MSALPSEIAASLGEHASGASYERIGAGLDSFLGETHLVESGGVLRVWARGSILDPLAELAEVSSAHVESGDLGAQLLLSHAKGECKVRLGYSERDRVAALLERVVARIVPAPAEPVASPSVEPELVELRARLLGVLRGAHAGASGRVAMLGALGARNDVKRDVQLARLECEDAEVAREPTAEQATERAARKAASRAENRRKQQAAARPTPATDAGLTAHVGEAWLPTTNRARRSEPAAPVEPSEPKRSALPWVVLVVLVLAGVLPALGKLLSAP
jgi:hypothetical protein